jgi:hypothetical protein
MYDRDRVGSEQGIRSLRLLRTAWGILGRKNAPLALPSIDVAQQRRHDPETDAVVVHDPHRFEGPSLPSLDAPNPSRACASAAQPS